MKKTYRLLAFLLCCAVIGWGIYSFALPVRYESRATVLVVAFAGSATALRATHEAKTAEEVEALKGLDLAPVAGLNGDEIKRGLRVKARKGSQLIDISFRHGDPTVATGVLNTLLQLYLKDHFERRERSVLFREAAVARDKAGLEFMAGKIDEAALRKADEEFEKSMVNARFNGSNVQIVRSPSAPVKVRLIL